MSRGERACLVAAAILVAALFAIAWAAAGATGVLIAFAGFVITPVAVVLVLVAVDALCSVLEDGGFGNYDALRESIIGTSGAGAALRGSKPQPKRSRPGRAPESDEPLIVDGQLAMELA